MIFGWLLEVDWGVWMGADVGFIREEKSEKGLLGLRLVFHGAWKCIALRSWWRGQNSKRW